MSCNEQELLFFGFQLSQCSLMSDLGFGAGKSWISVKRSVDCLIGEESTSSLTAEQGGMFTC